MFTRLRHRAVRRRHNQDRPIHLRRACDHVLHIIRVTRAIHMRVMTVRRLVFNMGRISGAAHASLPRSLSLAINTAPPSAAKTFVIAAVNVVLPWSICPMVPMLMCGLFRSNLAFATFVLPLFVPSGKTRIGQTTAAVRQIRNRRFAPDNTGAGDGNRTHTTSLEGWGSTFELHPPN